MEEIGWLFSGAIFLTIGIFLFRIGEVARVLGIILILIGIFLLSIVFYFMSDTKPIHYNSHHEVAGESKDSKEEKRKKKLAKKREREITCPDCGLGKLKGWARCASCRNERRRERKEERQREWERDNYGRTWS